MAQAIAERLQGRQGGDRKTDQVGNISHLDEQGRTKDIAAKKAGLGSGKTLEAAQRIAERLGSRQGQRTDLPANAGKLERGETADIAARKSGFGSADTMRRAQKVADTAAPELVEAMATPPTSPPSSGLFCVCRIWLHRGYTARYSSKSARITRTSLCFH